MELAKNLKTSEIPYPNKFDNLMISCNYQLHDCRQVYHVVSVCGASLQALPAFRNLITWMECCWDAVL